MPTSCTCDGAVRIQTPSRLHFTLIDMNGESGRIDGSLGMALDEPAITIRARAAESCEVQAEDPALAAFVGRELRAMARRMGVAETLEVTIDESIPAHRGLGSGTQWRLALLAALDQLHGCGLTETRMCELSERGGTSGIGLHAFFRGGFLLDGGHSLNGDKRGFAPSRFAVSRRKPPLLVRYDLPARLGVLLFIPDGLAGLSGEAERRFMTASTPIPRAEVEAVSHLVLMGILPAFAEGDLALLGRSLDALQEVGWKLRHWQRSDLAPLRGARDVLRRCGVAGCGLSSTGPTLFGFFDAQVADAGDLRRRVAAGLLKAGAPAGRVVTTRGNNQGARIAKAGAP